MFILADDLGNADLGYRGSDIRTPNIDALAKGGVQCEAFYGMPVCTPSRASLMTGQIHNPLRTANAGHLSQPHLRAADRRTNPAAGAEAGGLQDADDRQVAPGARGPEVLAAESRVRPLLGNLVGEVDYFTKDRGGLTDWQRNGTFLKEDGYYTTLIGDEAVKLIESQDGGAAVLSVLRVAGTARALPGAAGICRSLQVDRRRQAAGLRGHDHGIRRPGGTDCRSTGAEKAARQHADRVQQRQRRRHRALFATPHSRKRNRPRAGALAVAQAAGFERQLRGGKGSLYQGGMCVPTIFNWPGKLDTGVVRGIRCTWWT